MRLDNSELAANIRNYIKHNKSLSLSNFGTLSFVLSSENFAETANYLLPPAYKLSLSKNQNSKIDHGFIEYLAEKPKEEGLVEDYHNLCSALQETEINQGILTIKNLGSFIGNPDQQTFNALDFIQESNYGLPGLIIKPLSQKSTKPTENQIINGKADSKPQINILSNIINIVSTAAIFFLLVFAYHNWPFPNNYSNQEQESIKTFQIDHNRLNQKPEKVLIDNRNSIDKNIIPGNIEKVETKASCALILGSFVKQQNAIDLQNTILISEYELYTEEFHEFYRVGVSVDCEKINGEMFFEIKKVLGVDPWLRIY